MVVGNATSDKGDIDHVGVLGIPICLGDEFGIRPADTMMQCSSIRVGVS
jgi:hypothetical protein